MKRDLRSLDTFYQMPEGTVKKSDYVEDMYQQDTFLEFIEK